MSIALAINNSLSGLAASQQALAVISQNVANANTEGYSKKVANQSTTIVAGVGNGVRIDEVTRLADSFLSAEVRRAASEDGEAKALHELTQLLQNLFGAPGNDLSVADDVSRFSTSLEALANNPENAGLRFSVLSEGQRLAENISKLAESAQSMRREADGQISDAVTRVNSNVLRVHDLNLQISRGIANNLPTVDLEDQRDLAIRKIAEDIDIQTFQRSDGRIVVATGSGQELVGDGPSALIYNRAASVEAGTVWGEMRVSALGPNGAPLTAGVEIVSAGVSSDVITSVTSGRIAGLLEMRDGILADFAEQTESLAAKLRDEVNAIHNQGVGFPAPRSLTGTTPISATTPFQASGTARIAVTDSSGALVASLDLDLSALGAVTAGDVVSAINTGLAGSATATISLDGELIIRADNANHGIAINDVGTAETTTGRGFSHFFGLNDFFVGAEASELRVNPIVVNDASRISTGSLSRTATAGQPAITPGDNRVAQALARLNDTVFSFQTAGGLAAQQATIGDYAAALIAINAARSSAAVDQADQKALILENVDHRLKSQTGVNVDEELATMVVFQNAFTVSARILRISSEMLETLNEMVS